MQAEAIQQQHVEQTDNHISVGPGEAIDFDTFEQMEAAVVRKKQLDVKEDVEHQKAVEQEKVDNS